MKNFIFILLALPLYSQEKLDSIFTSEGEVLPVHVKEITDKFIKYNYANEELLNTISKNSVTKIHFKSGRKQEFSSHMNLSPITHYTDWKNVQISNIPSEVEGLMKVGTVGAKAKGFTTLSSIGKLQDRAYDKLKIQSAMMGANIVYVINQNTEDAIYGGDWGGSKTPSVTLSGTCYTSKKIKKTAIKEGNYLINKIVRLKANDINVNEITPNKPVVITITHNLLKDKNGFVEMKNVINNGEIKKGIESLRILDNTHNSLVILALHKTRGGKTTYYNIFLDKQ